MHCYLGLVTDINQHHAFDNVPTFWHTIQLPSSGWSEAEGCSLIHGNYCGSKCQDVQHSAVQLEVHVIKRVWKRGVKSDFPQFFEHKLRWVWLHLLRRREPLSWSINSLPCMGPTDSSPCSQKSPLILCQMNPVHTLKIYLRSILHSSFTMPLTNFNTKLTLVIIMLTLIILTILNSITGMFNLWFQQTQDMQSYANSQPTYFWHFWVWFHLKHYLVCSFQWTSSHSGCCCSTAACLMLRLTTTTACHNLVTWHCCCSTGKEMTSSTYIYWIQRTL